MAAFNPLQPPNTPVNVYDINNNIIGVYIPHSRMIQPSSHSRYGPLFVIGMQAFTLGGDYVGDFTSDGYLLPQETALRVP